MKKTFFGTPNVFVVVTQWVSVCGGGKLNSTLAKMWTGRRQKNGKMFLAGPCVCVFEKFHDPEMKYSVWIGGSILASLSTFEDMWLTKEGQS